MDDDRMKDSGIAIGTVKNRLINGDISEDICDVIKRNPEIFEKQNIHHDEISAMICMKAKLAYCPEPLAYSIKEQERVDYIYENINNPSIALVGENEKRFMNGPMPGEEIEFNLLRLPKVLYPIVEQSGKYDYCLDYVKSLKGIERITPKMAFWSMDYYLSMLSYEEWDPVGVDDEFGRVTGGFLRRGTNCPNPLKKFPPNLLSEEQWEKLKELNPGVTYGDLPKGAFKINRVTDVQIYPRSDGGMVIRCKVDDEQQEGKLLSDNDVRNCNGYEDKLNLAVSYFIDAFAKEPERSAVLVR